MKAYLSKFTNEHTNFANYITQILLERKAKKEGKTLSGKFWNLPEWKKHYQLCLIQVNRALLAFPENAILNAVTRKDMLWAWSISAPSVKQAIIEENRKLEKEEIVKEVKLDEVVQEVPEGNSTRPVFNVSKNKL